MQDYRGRTWLVPVAVAALTAGCAARAPAAGASAHGPYVGGATGDAFACRPGYLVVENGEAFPVRLVARSADAAPPDVRGAGVQELLPVASGKRDTLVELRRDYRYVEALPDEGHAVYPTNQTNGPPSNRPTSVKFSCTASAAGDT